MIYVGIDDTDTLETRGTNHLARELVVRLRGTCEYRQITRHQLLVDPRVPYTSHNGSACILLEPNPGVPVTQLIAELRAGMLDDFIPGSDPGLCVSGTVPEAVVAFGRRCQRELIAQREARELAKMYGIHLEGLGGTEDGVIGALAAIGLAAGGDDGRVVGTPSWPHEFGGPQELAELRARGVEVRRLDSNELVIAGTVDVGKRLRPNLRSGRIVLFVEPVPDATASGDTVWQAVRLP
jgi:hypothetical protein